MKKFFTFVVAFALAAGVHAQTAEQLYLSIDTYPWHYTADPGSEVSLTFSSQWGEYGIIGSSNAIDPAEYKGFKIEYVGYPETVSEEDGYVQTSIGGKQWNDFDPSKTVLESDFNDDVKALKSLDKFNIQGKTANAKIDIKSFALIKNDGTEVPVTSYAAGGWGRSLGPSAAPVITFTGQYGGLQIVTKDGASCTYENDGTNTEVQSYKIEFAEALPSPVNIELDGASGGFAWFSFDAGATEIKFDVKADNCGSTDEETEVFTPKNLEKLYLKENTGVAGEGSTWPSYTVKVKSITRTVGTSTGISNAVVAPKANPNAPIYNLAGQKVSKSYKGVVIQNGKKFVQ